MNKYRTGKRPARHGAIRHKFRTFFDASELPTPPTVFGRTSYFPEDGWGMLYNDQAGNCLAAETIVSAENVRAGYKSRYDGPIVTLSLASGKRLSVTPNHAVLTTNGFARAKSIKKLDHLVGTCGAQEFPRLSLGGFQGNFNQSPTSIEKIFRSLSVPGQSIREVVPRSIDFHGDEKFIDGNVEIVGPDGFLRRKFDAPLGKPNAHNQVGPASQLKGSFVRSGALLLTTLRSLFAAQSYVGFGSYGSSLGYAHAGVAQPQGLSLSSQLLSGLNDFFFKVPPRNAKFLAHVLHRGSGDIFSHSLLGYVPISALSVDGENDSVGSSKCVASAHQPSADGCHTDPHLFGNLCQCFPGLIEADSVIDINIQGNIGAHVYDLATDSRWYTANGLIVHNCVVAGGMHETMLWGALGGHGAPQFTDAQAISDYAAITGYDPKQTDANGDNPTDQGTDMVVAARYRRDTGLLDAHGVRHKIDGYVSIETGNVEEVALAAYLFGGVGVGALLPADAEDQFDANQPWTVTSKRGEDGHYFPIVGRNEHGNLLCVTWGRLHAITPPWLERWMDEGVLYFSFESLRTNTLLSQRGMDMAGLRAASGKFG